jgi:hypothetical protein
MVVPASSDLVRNAKAKLRDVAFNSGLIDFNDCVVTPDRALVCSSKAVGTPLAAALRQMKDLEAEAAETERQRLKAESTVRKLAAEIERLNQQVKQAEVAAAAGRFFPPMNGEAKPTGLTITNPSTDDLMTTEGQPEVIPPSEED